MIAITGDLVDSSKTNIEIAESLIQRLVKIAPCYYVTGNHEAWIGEKYQELEKKLTQELSFSMMSRWNLRKTMKRYCLPVWMTPILPTEIHPYKKVS